MTNKTKTPRSEVLKMHLLYQKRIPVDEIAKSFGVSRQAVYWLFDREALSLKRKPWEVIIEDVVK
jgi:predicted DNA-binding protein YlxM (UPF0122 family)